MSARYKLNFMCLKVKFFIGAHLVCVSFGILYLILLQWLIFGYSLHMIFNGLRLNRSTSNLAQTFGAARAIYLQGMVT